MRSNHFVAALAVVACLSFASSAYADSPEATTVVRDGTHVRIGDQADDGGIAAGFCTAAYSPACDGVLDCTDFISSLSECLESCFGTTSCAAGGCIATTCTWKGEEIFEPTGCCECTGSPDVGPITRPACNDISLVDCTWTPEVECVPPVPAVSEWGMASVVLLLLAGLTIKFGAMRFRKAA